MEEMFFCPNCMAKAVPVDGKCPVCGCDVNIQNAPHQLPVNTILNGRYLVGKVLGAGGFGITYIGYDLKLDSKVAVKEYYPSGAANRSSSLTVFPTTRVKGNPFEIGKDRFLKEAKTLSEFVGDSNIVTLRDYFEENGTAYIVMEYLEGEDLSHYAKEHGRFELDEALDLLEPAMLALDKVHKKGLIHRDISTSNIMVLSDGRVKVLDFGSARLQNASGELSLSVMLKPGYAPMEQYSTHGEQGSWTDVYAMSATVYRLITGKTPPPSTDRILDDTIELPSSLGVKITPEQEAALMRGLALRVPDRTQTMAELAESLRGKKKTSLQKSTKPAVDLKKKAAPEKPAKPKKKEVPAKEPEKKVLLEKPAKTQGEKKQLKKYLPVIGAAVLALLVLVLAVPAMKNTDTAAVPAAATETPAADAAAPAGTAAATDGPKVGQTVLKCAFSQTIENPEAKTLQKLSDDLYDATEGRYSIEVYPDAQLGDQQQTLEQCTMDALDMTLVANSIIETYVPDFAILGTPYVYDSVEHQQRVFESGKLDELYAATRVDGFIVLSAYSFGARNLYTRDKAVMTPDDLNGMKIRVMGSETCIAMMNAMGGVGVAMAMSEVYSAIQTGVIDGAESNIITYVDLMQYEVAPYYNRTGHLMIPDELCISANVFDSMSAEDQEALKKCASESIAYMFDLCAELRSDYEAAAADRGVIFSDADIPAFQALCQDMINDVANRTKMTKAVYEAIISER